MLKPHHGLAATERHNGDERSSRNPDVYIARDKQRAANRAEWRRRAREADRDGLFALAQNLRHQSTIA